jgi:hypothetical protein
MERSGKKIARSLFQDCFLHDAQDNTWYPGKSKGDTSVWFPAGERKRKVYREEMRR